MKTKKEVRTFYHQFSGRVIVGLEASGYSPWFEQLLEDLGHEVWLGDATEIRRRGAHFQPRAGASETIMRGYYETDSRHSGLRKPDFAGT